MDYAKLYSLTKKLSLLALLFISNIAMAQVPDTINYQGYLTNSSGEPINATQNITFRIYSQASGGVELWSETQQVLVDQGAFATALGSGSNTFPNALFDGPLFLGISVNSDAEMVPRTSFTSAPFALNAERLDGMTVDDVAYSDVEARAAMGAKSNNNPFHHDRFTANEAVAAMGSKSNNNPLNHDRFTNANAVSAVLAAGGAGSNLDADLLDGMQASDIISASGGPQGTPISSLPFTITAPGDYYLATDLTTSSNQAINIDSSHVNLNLNGKVLTSTGTSTSATAAIIRFFGSSSGGNSGFITIRNGTIAGAVGAQSALALRLSNVTNPVIDNLRVLDTRGIELNNGNCGARITNNFVNGDSTISSFNTAPTIESRGIDASGCRGAIIKNNVVVNSFSSSSVSGGITSRSSLVTGNTVENILNPTGRCVSGIGSVISLAVTRRCFSTGSTDQDNVVSVSGGIVVDSNLDD